MNCVGGERGLLTDPQSKERKWEVIGCWKNCKKEDEWHQGKAECGQICREKSINGRLLGAGRREVSR